MSTWVLCWPVKLPIQPQFSSPNVPACFPLSVTPSESQISKPCARKFFRLINQRETGGIGPHFFKIYPIPTENLKLIIVDCHFSNSFTSCTYGNANAKSFAYV